VIRRADRPTWGDVGEIWSAAPQQTIIELVDQACHRHAESPALIFEDGLVVSYARLLDLSQRFAGYLSARISQGDRVALMVGNRAEFVVAWLAVVANRGVLVSVNPEDRSHDAFHVLYDSGAVLAIVGADQLPVVQELRGRLPQLRDVLVVDGDEPDGLACYDAGATPLPFSEARCERTDITNIYYTSGTTGQPKGCMCDHEWWLRTVDVLLRRTPKGREDRELCCLQFFYSDPGHQLLEALQSGGALVVMRRFSVSRFWEVVRQHRVTDLLSFSSIPVFLLKAPPHPLDREHHVRLARHLAMPPELHRQIVDRWGFMWIDGYGITEGNVVAGMPLEYAEEMVGAGSIGIPCPEVELRIVEDSGNDVAQGEVGEFWMRGPGMFRGYLNRPDATEEVMRGGWLHTGDLGRADAHGFLYFSGRKKDIIRRSGENLTAAEVEDVLRLHPGVLDAAVLAVPDVERGEEVKAYIVLVAGETQASVPPEELTRFCADRLAPYKVPRYVEYRAEDFPRTPSMRVRKEVLRAERPDLAADCWDGERMGTLHG
jgi:crotonobetaine/carnitine-CoA ligase